LADLSAIPNPKAADVSATAGSQAAPDDSSRYPCADLAGI
jgi:hypothetical protein